MQTIDLSNLNMNYQPIMVDDLQNLGVQFGNVKLNGVMNVQQGAGVRVGNMVNKGTLVNV